MSRKDRIRAQIAARRDVSIFRAVASVSLRYLRAYNNALNWDMRVNGEAFALSNILRATPGDVLDVGANEGQWALMALDQIGVARLHCFEAVPATFERLKRAIGRRSNVTLNGIGLGSETKSIVMHFCPESTDRSSTFCVQDGYEKEVITVSVIRGDQYVEAKGIRQVSYLKIDVEGMEMEVLKGFEATFRAGIIKAVQFEHGAAHIISRHFLKDFIDFFETLNFRVFECYPHSLREVRYNLDYETFIGKNYLAVSPHIVDL
jgi:FkbM family methyltransferase